MDELIDILNADGSLTGTTALKSHAHRMGLFHATAHVWFYTTDGKILIQQRGATKNIFPLLWDVSVAGHISAGEKIITSAIREIEEEIGLTITSKELQKVGVFKSIQKHADDLTDCEFHHTFICELTVPLNALTKQESEVEDLTLILLTSLLDVVTNKHHSKTYVPHSVDYYKTIEEAIRAVL